MEFNLGFKGLMVLRRYQNVPEDQTSKLFSWGKNFIVICYSWPVREYYNATSLFHDSVKSSLETCSLLANIFCTGWTCNSCVL